MGTGNSVEEEAKFYSKGKFNFSGIREPSKPSIFSCLCNNSDSQLSNDITNSNRESGSKSRLIPRQKSLQIDTSTKGDCMNPEMTERITLNKEYQIVSTVVHHKPQYYTPHHRIQSLFKDSSSRTSYISTSSISSKNSLLSQTPTSFQGSSLFSKSSKNESFSVKNYKKDLQASKNSIFELNDLFEDIPSALSKDTVVIRGERKYKGDVVGGKPHGYGKEVWPDGSKYEGMYDKGVRTGQGIYNWPDKSCYKGSFKENEMCGFGIFEWENGNRYEGMWKGSKMHGEGKFVWRNGNAYLGGYEEGVKHGDGVFTYADGKAIRAKWVKGDIQLNV